MQMKLQFLNSIPLEVISGGNIYNKAIIEGLRLKGAEIDYNATPLDEDYDISIVDSLCMDKVNPNSIKLTQQIVALIHQIPKLSDHTINFYRDNAKFIVTGESAKSELIKLWQVNKNNIRVLRPGIPDHWKSKTEFRDQPKRIIIVSNFIQNKGFELLISILKKLSHLDLKFHIVGNNELDKGYGNKIIETIEKTNNKVQFHFNLKRDEVYNQLLKSDIFLSLSKSETFGMSLFEALSLGLPCIAYKTGDFNYFRRYPNYLMLSDYSEDRFVEIIEQWVSNSETYKQHCNSTYQNKRNWNHLIEAFSMYLKNNMIIC